MFFHVIWVQEGRSQEVPELPKGYRVQRAILEGLKRLGGPLPLLRIDLQPVGNGAVPLPLLFSAA